MSIVVKANEFNLLIRMEEEMARLENLKTEVEEKRSRLPDSSKHELDPELERIEKMIEHGSMLKNECR
jgi:hypothetical protein